MAGMALPTSVSFSSWTQEEATEETPLLSVPTRPATATSSEGHMTSTATQLSTHAALALHHLTDIQEVKDTSASEDSPSSVAPVAEVASLVRREASSSRGSRGLSLHVAVTADTTHSSLCTVTDTHRSPHSSIVASRLVSSGTRMSSPGQCCGVSVTPAPNLAGGALALNEAGVSSRKSSLEERLSRIWSTSTDSNADCESENCDGTDLRCRKCGKIVSVPKTEENSAMAGVTQVLKGVISQCASQHEALSRGTQQQSQVTLAPTDRQHKTSPAKRKNSLNYSTLLSACSRNIKKRGNRRQSVDVIYAREPAEPDIEKIKAKRRLSRQTDVSSIELMTLNEGNELDDPSGKGPNPIKAADNVATLQVQGENIRLSHCQLSPRGTRIHNLRASSSTDSCPRAPWNSLETNLSSQEVEEKYIINDTRSQPIIPETFNLDPRSSIDPGELDSDHEEGGTDQEERVSEEEAERTATGGTRRRRSSARPMQDNQRPGRLLRPDHEPMVWQDWSAEAVVLVALLVYIACKVLRFMEAVVPRRPANRK